MLKVAKYSLKRRLPPELKDKLPDPKKLGKQIMQELGGMNISSPDK